ncbi:MAG: hypothetical protein A2428_10080 [Bdellovibrionales bacterium RIFOXYC1_FULL_54_43]|nr:MAG: hypothetical protein A2428_10080 [Bdellovibrionales bacterium RIFOXYC1_FULL_54_43]OFZ80531.1 MAG: hypothetical protein A2603_13175 [Bdellovibrionales bacterium RIFOXYD1_FULL_55_31]
MTDRSVLLNILLFLGIVTGGPFAPTDTWARSTPLYQVSSVYTSNRDTDVRIHGTGTPVEFNVADPKTGEVKRVCAILTAGHVSGGRAETLQVQLSGEPPVHTAGRCVDADHDLELVLLSTCQGFRSLGVYSEARGLFEIKSSNLDNWVLERGLEKKQDVGLNRDITYWISRLWKKMRTDGVGISVGQWGGSESRVIPQVLVPEGIAWRPRSSDTGTNLVESTPEDFLPHTQWGQEIASRSALSPGMSGVPLIADIENDFSVLNWIRGTKRGAAGKQNSGVLLGIASRVMKDSSRSYFISAETIQVLVTKARKSGCPSKPDKHWDYWFGPDGEGTTFRTFETKWGRIRELPVLSARAGSGGSGDVGSGGSGDIGNNPSKRATVDLGYNSYDPFSFFKSPGQNPYIRHGVLPGLQIESEQKIAGKPSSTLIKNVLGIKAKPKKPSSSVLDPVVLFADASAIDFMKKNDADYDFEFMDEQQFFQDFFSRTTRNGECVELRGSLTLVSSQSQNFTSCQMNLLFSKAGLDFGLACAGQDKIQFKLDRRGRLPNQAYFVPEITVAGTPSGRTYVIDLTRFFFVDLSRVYDQMVNPEADWRQNTFFRWKTNADGSQKKGSISDSKPAIDLVTSGWAHPASVVFETPPVAVPPARCQPAPCSGTFDTFPADLGIPMDSLNQIISHEK